MYHVVSSHSKARILQIAAAAAQAEAQAPANSLNPAAASVLSSQKDKPSPSVPAAAPASFSQFSPPRQHMFSTSAVFAVVAAAYISTAYPSIPGGDAGELVVTACNLGVAHPPGYPTFTMLSYLFQKAFPFGHVAWRLNVLSGLLGAGAAALLHLSMCQLTNDSSLGVAVAALYAFAPTVWMYSTTAEVFALNNFLCSLLLCLTIVFFARLDAESWLGWRFASKRSSNTSLPTSASSLTAVQVALVGAFACGVAMTNQHTSVFFVAPTAALLTLALLTHGALDGRVVLLLLAAVVAGMSPYLYMPIAAFFKPMVARVSLLSTGPQRKVQRHHACGG